jgi:ketosteroid isomerase-like protein
MGALLGLDPTPEPPEFLSMSIKVLLDAPKHPAREVAIRSITCVESGDREGWLGLFAEDGSIEDPVGKSPLDPTGTGHRGLEAIATFYDKVIAPGDLRFCIRQSFACGSECANVGTITAKSAKGIVARTELVMLYRLDDAGKIQSLRAFWEFDDTVASMF